MAPFVCLAKWKGSGHQLPCKLAAAPFVTVHSADVVGAETTFECAELAFGNAAISVSELLERACVFLEKNMIQRTT